MNLIKSFNMVTKFTSVYCVYITNAAKNNAKKTRNIAYEFIMHFLNILLDYKCAFIV